MTATSSFMTIGFPKDHQTGTEIPKSIFKKTAARNDCYLVQEIQKEFVGMSHVVGTTDKGSDLKLATPELIRLLKTKANLPKGMEMSKEVDSTTKEHGEAIRAAVHSTSPSTQPVPVALRMAENKKAMIINSCAEGPTPLAPVQHITPAPHVIKAPAVSYTPAFYVASSVDSSVASAVHLEQTVKKEPEDHLFLKAFDHAPFIEANDDTKVKLSNLDPKGGHLTVKPDEVKDNIIAHHTFESLLSGGSKSRVYAKTYLTTADKPLRTIGAHQTTGRVCSDMDVMKVDYMKETKSSNIYKGKSSCSDKIAEGCDLMSETCKPACRQIDKSNKGVRDDSPKDSQVEDVYGNVLKSILESKDKNSENCKSKTCFEQNQRNGEIQTGKFDSCASNNECQGSDDERSSSSTDQNYPMDQGYDDDVIIMSDSTDSVVEISDDETCNTPHEDSWKLEYYTGIKSTSSSPLDKTCNNNNNGSVNDNKDYAFGFEELLCDVDEKSHANKSATGTFNFRHVKNENTNVGPKETFVSNTVHKNELKTEAKPHHRGRQWASAGSTSWQWSRPRPRAFVWEPESAEFIPQRSRSLNNNSYIKETKIVQSTGTATSDSCLATSNTNVTLQPKPLTKTQTTKSLFEECIKDILSTVSAEMGTIKGKQLSYKINERTKYTPSFSFGSNHRLSKKKKMSTNAVGTSKFLKSAVFKQGHRSYNQQSRFFKKSEKKRKVFSSADLIASGIWARKANSQRKYRYVCTPQTLDASGAKVTLSRGATGKKRQHPVAGNTQKRRVGRPRKLRYQFADATVSEENFTMNNPNQHVYSVHESEKMKPDGTPVDQMPANALIIESKQKHQNKPTICSYPSTKTASMESTGAITYIVVSPKTNQTVAPNIIELDIGTNTNRTSVVGPKRQPEQFISENEYTPKLGHEQNVGYESLCKNTSTKANTTYAVRVKKQPKQLIREKQYIPIRPKLKNEYTPKLGHEQNATYGSLCRNINKKPNINTKPMRKIVVRPERQPEPFQSEKGYIPIRPKLDHEQNVGYGTLCKNTGTKANTTNVVRPEKQPEQLMREKQYIPIIPKLEHEQNVSKITEVSPSMFSKPISVVISSETSSRTTTFKPSREILSNMVYTVTSSSGTQSNMTSRQPQTRVYPVNPSSRTQPSVSSNLQTRRIYPAIMSSRTQPSMSASPQTTGVYPVNPSPGTQSSMTSSPPPPTSWRRRPGYESYFSASNTSIYNTSTITSVSATEPDTVGSTVESETDDSDIEIFEVGHTTSGECIEPPTNKLLGFDTCSGVPPTPKPPKARRKRSRNTSTNKAAKGVQILDGVNADKVVIKSKRRRCAKKCDATKSCYIILKDVRDIVERSVVLEEDLEVCSVKCRQTFLRRKFRCTH